MKDDCINDSIQLERGKEGNIDDDAGPGDELAALQGVATPVKFDVKPRR